MRQAVDLEGLIDDHVKAGGVRGRRWQVGMGLQDERKVGRQGAPQRHGVQASLRGLLFAVERP